MAISERDPSQHATRPDYTSVVTCYFEETSIDEFYSRLKSALDSLERTYEIVMVNDGSTDGTWEKLKDIYERDHKVRVVIDLFKNSGQAAACTACLDESRGRAIIFLDSDLQLAPEELPILVKEYEKGYDLVTGYRKNRNDSLARIIPGKLANIFMRSASESNIRDFGCTFKIFNADLLRAFHFGPHHALNLTEIIRRVQRIKEVPVTHHTRKYGKSGWTFAKLWRYNMDNVVLMLERPFQIIGALCAIGGLLFALRVLLSFFSDFKFLEGVSTGLLLNGLAFTLLVLAAILALIGEFSIRSFVRLQNLPAYIVREKLTRGDD